MCVVLFESTAGNEAGGGICSRRPDTSQRESKPALSVVDSRTENGTDHLACACQVYFWLLRTIGARAQSWLRLAQAIRTAKDVPRTRYNGAESHGAALGHQPAVYAAIKEGCSMPGAPTVRCVASLAFRLLIPPSLISSLHGSLESSL